MASKTRILAAWLLTAATAAAQGGHAWQQDAPAQSASAPPPAAAYGQYGDLAAGGPPRYPLFPRQQLATRQAAPAAPAAPQQGSELPPAPPEPQSQQQPSGPARIAPPAAAAPSRFEFTPAASPQTGYVGRMLSPAPGDAQDPTAYFGAPVGVLPSDCLVPQRRRQRTEPLRTRTQPCGGECCGSPAATSGCGYGCVVENCGPSAAGCATPWFASLHGLLMTRSLGKFMVVTEDAGLGREVLTTRDVDYGPQGGAEVRLGRRMDDRQALEGVWWSVFPEGQAASVFGAATPGGLASRLNFADLEIVDGAATNPVASYFNGSQHQRLRREFAATNVELNLLYLPVSCCSSSSLTFTMGTRYLRLDENFHLLADIDNTAWGDPTGEICYLVDLENHLAGFHWGGQYFRHVTRRLSVYADGAVGVFSNLMRHRQEISNSTGSATITAGPDAGEQLRLRSTRGGVSALGELRVGGHWQFARTWRATTTYRLTAVSNVALPEDQIPVTFADRSDIHRIRNHGSILLHGLLFGVEHRF